MHDSYIAIRNSVAITLACILVVTAVRAIGFSSITEAVLTLSLGGCAITAIVITLRDYLKSQGVL